MAATIEWLGHSSVRLRGRKVVYIDPWQLRVDLPKADYVLITHAHYDHCSLEDVTKVSKPGTLVLAPLDCGLPDGFVQVKPGMHLKYSGVGIETVPAYNLNKKFHPRANNWVGYVITIDDERIYITGDTDHVPEMDAIRADVLLLPVGGTYTMTAEEAAQYANKVKPRRAIPIHWGGPVGSHDDAARFKKHCTVPVDILAPTA